jgi:hypothetical protein
MGSMGLYHMDEPRPGWWKLELSSCIGGPVVTVEIRGVGLVKGINRNSGGNFI